MILPVLVSVLALAGAPQSTDVTCNSHLVGALGVTYPEYITVVDGVSVNGPMAVIVLGQEACGALLYASASTAERAAIRRLNPSVNFSHLVGEGLQVALHEAEHVALNSDNECLVEKTARQKVNGLLAGLGGDVAAEQAYATASDASMPAEYHGC